MWESRDQSRHILSPLHPALCFAISNARKCGGREEEGILSPERMFGERGGSIFVFSSPATHTDQVDHSNALALMPCVRTVPSQQL